ncbi:MAG: energy-coupling factor transporter ATPase [Geobacteraceae bacterium]|nr:energy-coupling factor transporter ATPase [Geobacteraceae bacterium]
MLNKEMLSIKIESLSHSYQQGTPFEQTALQNITFTIEPGMFLGIAGRSGSGKTTLLQHLNGLLKPTSGRITINGSTVDARRMRDLRRQIGLVFQHPEHQLFEETVFKDISFGLTGTGLNAAAVGDRVRESLAVVGLSEDILERSPFELSGGEKRRVAIAGVLVMNPTVLVLDEPAAGLDPGGRREILDFISKLRSERNITVVLATHDMAEMARFADRMVVLNNGSIALNGSTREIFRDVEALENAGLEPPQITRLMLKLKKVLPEANDGILTVEEAIVELKRLYCEGWRWGDYDKRFADGPLSARQFDAA